jgi:FMN phosphatase YigB (HAD superfamily)
MANIDWSQVKVVSWDIDGTLYDLKAFMRALKQDLLIRAITFRWFSLTRDLVRLVRFKRHMDNVRHNCPDFAVGKLSGRDEIGRTMDTLYARLLPSIGMLPGVNGLLDWFDEQSVPQVIFSDYRPSTKLSALHLDGRFQSIFAGEDLGHLKPSPTVFRNIIEQLGITPAELLHIGDRPDTDGAAASEVGFQVAIIGVDFDTADELAVHLQSTSTSH